MEEEEDRGAMEVDMDVPPEIAVSEFDYSVDNHFKALDTIAGLCGPPNSLDADHPDIRRFSNSITFLREWSDFNYPPRTVRFACQYNLKEKDVIGEIKLPQFSAASVPKKETRNGSEVGPPSSEEFIMHVGGAVWALDWCPRVDDNTENHIKTEFIAVAAHPPESSYHKIGAPLTGRGVIQIWSLLTAHIKEDVPSKGNNKSKPYSRKKEAVESNEPHKLPKPRGRPRKKPIIDTVENKDKLPRPRGRPRKKPITDPVENKGTDAQYTQPLAIEYPMDALRLHSSDRTSENSSKVVCDEDDVQKHGDFSQTEHANVLLLNAPKGKGNKAKAGKEDQVHNNGLHVPEQCEHRESPLRNPLASPSVSLDSMSPNKNISYISSCDANTFKKSIPKDVALPRMMLCLAHNGKVAWDLKWRPVKEYDPASMSVMGYLAVLLGNGALEVWQVPFPHTVKLVYPIGQERIDPRFIKLQPVFRSSMLKCGDKQSIPLTVEWSASAPHDMILAGCHDGVVALWKFSVNDSLTETRPMLSFSADTGPIRALSWAPTPSDPESANIMVTAGHRGFKFWDIRDPFRPLWDHIVQGITYGLTWLPNPRCVFGSVEDGTLWLLRLENIVSDIPITGKSVATTKHGFHNFECSTFAIWSVQASPLTGMVAYCGEEGTTFCFQPTARFIKDPTRNRAPHFLCGSLFEEEHALIVASPSTNSSFSKRHPGTKRCIGPKDLDKRLKEQMVKGLSNNEQALAICEGNDLEGTKKKAPKTKQGDKSQLENNDRALLCGGENVDKLGGTGKEDRGEEIEVFPPKNVAMHRVRWNANKGSEKWLCYGGAAGLLRCQEIDPTSIQ